MAHDELGPADIDRLADYIGGALHGPDEAAVARLIAEDPQWRTTYELLAPGMAAVGADLHALGVAEPMPADLAARLDEAFTPSAAALSSVAEPTVIDPELAEPHEPHLEPVRGGRHLSVVPDSGVPDAESAGTEPAGTEPAGTEPGAEPAGPGPRVRDRRKQRMRWAVPVAAAAGVLAFAGVGIDYLAGQTGGSADQATSAAGGSAEQAAPMMGSDSAGVPPAVPADQILETGTNYTAASLATAPGAARAAATNRQAVPKADASQSQPAAELRDTAELNRLRARDALQACVEAIAQANAGGPITVDAVDYARYDGRPALVVRFTAAGLTWVYAAGPNCGAPDRGAEVINRVQVR